MSRDEELNKTLGKDISKDLSAEKYFFFFSNPSEVEPGCL